MIGNAGGLRSLHAATAIALVGVATAGCVTEQGAAPHEQPLAATNLALTGPSYTVPQDGWWHALGDPQLDALVATALARNPGLAGALARVRVAREQVQVADAAASPQLNFDAHATRTRLSENYVFPPPFGGGTWWDARLGINLAWNLDFWGRQAAIVEQAARTADAAALDAASAELLLASAVSQAYVDFARALQVERVALRAQQQRRTLAELTAKRVRAGLDSSVEAQVADANLEQSAVDVEQARLGVAVARHAIATLTGAGALTSPAFATPALDFERSLPVPSALPADLLARRSDVRAAQARVASAIAGRAAAHAAFYPNVNLAGFAGFTSIGLDDLLQPGSRELNLGPALHLPIFDAGRLNAEYRRSGAEVDVAIASYNDTVLRAVREAADQVSRLDSLAVQLAAQQRSLQSAEQAYSFALQRYEAGLSNQLTVLNAESQVLAARRQRIQLLADRSNARIGLLVALGGHSFQESPK